MTALSFHIATEPIPKERARVSFGRNGARAYTPAKTVNFEAEVRAAFLSARSAANTTEKFEGAIRIHITAIRSNHRRADWDNIAKAVTDALNKIAWADDNQIVDAHVIKIVNKNEVGITVEILEVNGEDYGYKPPKAKTIRSTRPKRRASRRLHRRAW